MLFETVSISKVFLPRSSLAYVYVVASLWIFGIVSLTDI